MTGQVSSIIGDVAAPQTGSAICQLLNILNGRDRTYRGFHRAWRTLRSIGNGPTPPNLHVPPAGVCVQIGYLYAYRRIAQAMLSNPYPAQVL